MDVTRGSAPFIVGFTDTSDGHVTSWEWDFGDGTSSETKNPAHSYATAGPVTVRLTVSGSGGTDVATVVDAIDVQPGPLARVEVSPKEITVQVQETAKLGVSAFDSFGNEISDVLLSWNTIGPVGSIDDSGLFAAGTQAGSYKGLVNVTAIFGEKNRQASYDVTINPGPLSTVALEPNEVSLDIGATQSFTVQVTDQFGNAITDALVSWSVLAGAGTLDDNQVFTAGTKAGVTLEAIRVDVVQGTARALATADVSIEPDPLTLVEVHPSDVVLDTGIPQQFTATGFDTYGNEVPGLAFIWTTTGGAITQDGLFTAGSQPGSYKIQASATFRTSIRSASAAVDVFSWSWWPGDGDANDAAEDNHGTLVNGTTFAPGIIGQAFSFDGRNDYVGLERQLSVSSGFTYSAWVNFNSSSIDTSQTFFNNNQFFIWKSGDSEGNRFGIWVTTDDQLVNPRAESVITVKPETWYHVAGTWDGAWLRIYVNGVLEDSRVREGPLTSRIAAARIGQGGQTFLTIWQFDGLIDEIKFYSRALNAEEIKARYEAEVQSDP